MISKTSQILASAIMALSISAASAATVTFEGQLSGAQLYKNNAGSNGAFVIDGTSFSNNYNSTFQSWSGFAISRTTDTTTPGPDNQYSAITGSGAGGSSTYAMSYGSDYDGDASVKFATTQDLSGLGASITNSTYASLSMQTGDKFAKKFGGEFGTDPDFFQLTIRGFAGGAATGTAVDFFLADFRFTDNSRDYIVDQWTYVDFSALGTVDEIRFSYTTTDPRGGTPSYFALDNFLAVPEPSAAVMAALGCLGLLSRRRR